LQDKIVISYPVKKAILITLETYGQLDIQWIAASPLKKWGVSTSMSAIIMSILI